MMAHAHSPLAKILAPLAIAVAVTYFGPVLSAFQLAPSASEPTEVSSAVSNRSEFFKNRPEPFLTR
jgi:hypothetical protein